MIEVRHLTKRYGGHIAVSDLSFTIEKGAVYGLLGPNGAGKSTTMNMMTGCLGATDGQVLIDGHSIAEEPMAAKRLVGYLPEQPPLYTDMTAEEYLRFVGRARGVPRRELSGQVERVMEKTRLTDMRARLIRNLSKGYRQRVGIAQALLCDPEIIILDEPTVGLDPVQIIEIRELIRELGHDHTLVLSSHILSEVQSVCDRVLILHHGKIICDSVLSSLRCGEKRLRAVIACGEGALLPALRTLRNVRRVTVERGGWICARAVVLPGVTVGTDAVVGAGAVLRQDLPAGALAVGMPARMLERKKDPHGGSGRLE